MTSRRPAVAGRAVTTTPSPPSGGPGPVRRLSDEAGQAAGVEVLAVGVLVFVVGTLLAAGSWAVVDAKFAVVGAARAATRAYVETTPGSDPMARADLAARHAIEATGRDPGGLQLQLLDGALTRCRTVRIEARYPVPSIRVRWLAPGTSRYASARAAELVDPFRRGLAGEPGTCAAEPT